MSGREDCEGLRKRPSFLGAGFIGDGIFPRFSCESDLTYSSGPSNNFSETVFSRFIAEEWEDTT